MSQGVIILIVMGLFFAGMAIFSYKFAYYKEKKEARRRFKQIEATKLKFQKIKEEHKGVRNLIDEKYRLASERRRAINQEFKELKRFNEELENR